MKDATKRIAKLGSFLLEFSLLAGAAFGSQVSFTTQPGASDPDGPLSAKATFTTSTNTLTVNLYNEVPNIVSDGQAISDLKWTFDSSASATSIASSSGDLVLVTNSGAIIDFGANPLIWKLESNGLGLCVLCVGGKPSELIIGPRNGDNKYDYANASIVQHIPNISTQATFILNVPGLRASNTVTSAMFSFGTTPGVDRDGGQPTPEPASLALMGMGVLGLGAFARGLRQTDGLSHGATSLNFIIGLVIKRR